jgi:hypothetical protein
LFRENKKREKDDEILKVSPFDFRKWKIRKSQMQQEIASLKTKVKDLQKMKVKFLKYEKSLCDLYEKELTDEERRMTN